MAVGDRRGAVGVEAEHVADDRDVCRRAGQLDRRPGAGDAVGLHGDVRDPGDEHAGAEVGGRAVHVGAEDVLADRRTGTRLHAGLGVEGVDDPEALQGHARGGRQVDHRTGVRLAVEDDLRVPRRPAVLGGGVDRDGVVDHETGAVREFELERSGAGDLEHDRVRALAARVALLVRRGAVVRVLERLLQAAQSVVGVHRGLDRDRRGERDVDRRGDERQGRSGGGDRHQCTDRAAPTRHRTAATRTSSAHQLPLVFRATPARTASWSDIRSPGANPKAPGHGSAGSAPFGHALFTAS